MFSNRIDVGLPLAVIELLARVGSIASVTLLFMLFAGEGLYFANPRDIVIQDRIQIAKFLLAGAESRAHKTGKDAQRSDDRTSAATLPGQTF